MSARRRLLRSAATAWCAGSVLWARLAAAEPSAAALPGLAQPPPEYGTGMVELRLQTATNAPSGGFYSLVTAQGAVYSTRAHVLVATGLFGAGYFITPALELGGELSSSYATDGSNFAQATELAPFIKLVSGIRAWGPGVFVEASPGLAAYAAEGVPQGAVLALTLWAGGHFPLGPSVAFVIGPSLTRLDDLEKFGEGTFILGLRLGLSIYFPRKRGAH